MSRARPDYLLDLPRDPIRVSVAFYDEAEKKKLLGYPSAERLCLLEEQGVDIPIAEFLTYFLFKLKRPEKAGWGSYKELERQVSKSVVMLEDWVDFADGSIRNAEGVKPQDTEIVERVGESIGLSVMNRVHGLTQADWARVPERRGRGAYKTFDYELGATGPFGSDGKSIIQVELKGSSNEDPHEISQSVRTHKGKIDTKKSSIQGLEKAKTYPHPAQLRYGAITVLGSKPGRPVRCWLTDPVPDELPLEPTRLRILNRLEFFADWITFIGPRSQLGASLRTRIASLRAMGNPSELDGVPLIRSDGEPFTFTRFDARSSRPNSFFSNRSYVTDGPAGGVVIHPFPGCFYFVGFQEDLLTLAVEQNHAAILDAGMVATTVHEVVRCVLSARRLAEIALPRGMEEVVGVSGTNRVFNLEGWLHYSPDGIVHGALRADSWERRNIRRGRSRR